MQLNATGLRKARSRQRNSVFGLSLAGAVLLATAAGYLATTNHAAALVPAVGCGLLPLVVRRKFSTLVLGLLFLSLLIEQYRVGVPSGDLTDHVPVFTSLSDGLGLPGVYFNPAEILMATVGLILLFRLGLRNTRPPITNLAAAVAAMAVAVLAGAVHGLAAGGDYKMVLWEIRPYVYVAVMFLFVSQLPVEIATLQALLWVFVAGVAIKTVQGLVLTLTILHAHPRPDYVLTHDDSLFFMLFVALVGALWLFRQKGSLRTFATVLLPAVIVVDLANNRRVSWLMLLAMLGLLAIIGWVRLPGRRPLIVSLAGVLAVLLTIYLPAYWNRGGFLAQPARAIRSAVNPSARDESSDQYRVIEDANLQLAIHRSPLIGTGFGIPIDYAIPIVDLSRIDPFIKYIPHDNVLYVWMRMGAAGAAVFWTFIGLACANAGRLLRSSNRTVACYGTFCLCAIAGYLILGDLDMGFFWFRVAIFMGSLFGALEIGAALLAQEQRDAARTQPLPETFPAMRNPVRARQPAAVS